MTGAEFVTNVLRKLTVIAGVQSPSAEDAATVLATSNRILNDWNAEYGATYASDISTHTITPALQPHTIGASGATWTVTQRPVSIEAANLVIAGIRTPLDIRDDDWWMSLSDPTASGAQPTDLNYRATWPNGSVYLSPVPSSAYSIELHTRFVLAALTLASTFTMPPGYESALMWTTAEECAPDFEKPVSASMVRSAALARQRIFTANAKTPHLVTMDAGLTNGSGRGGKFDIRNLR